MLARLVKLSGVELFDLEPETLAGSGFFFVGCINAPLEGAALLRDSG
jgi:hypothetical protein